MIRADMTDGATLSGRARMLLSFVGWSVAITGLLLVVLAAPSAASDSPDPAALLTPSEESWPLFRGSRSQTGVSPSKLPEALEPKWTFDAESDIESTVAIADGMVYFGTFGGTFLAVSLDDGKEQWRYQVGDHAIQSSAAVFDGAVYFGDEFGNFYSLDAKTGEVNWQFEAQGEILSSPTFDRDRVIIGSYDQFLYALKRSDGSVVWKVETEGYIHATPAVIGSWVTVSGCDGYLWLIDVDSGEVVDRLDLGGQAGASPAVVGSRAYVGTYENQVLALDVESRKVLWTYEHPQRKFPYYASAAVSEDTVIIGGRDKILRGLAADTGETVWEWNTGARIDSSAVIVGSRAYVGSKNGKVLGVGVRTGDVEWEFDTGSAIIASPAVADGKLVIGTLDGVLYCFG